MNTEQVIQFLVDRGYKEYPVFSDGQVFFGQLSCPEGTPKCETNDNKVFWNSEVFDFEIKGHNVPFQSVVIKIVGEHNKLWFDLECYSISFSELKEKIDLVERKLLDCWKVVCSND